VHIHEVLSQIRKAERELTTEYGRFPSEEEIAARLDMSLMKLKFIRQKTQNVVSMDASRPGGGRKGGSFGDEVRLVDTIRDTEPLQDKKEEKTIMKFDLEKLLVSLSPREADVVSYHGSGRSSWRDQHGRVGFW